MQSVTPQNTRRTRNPEIDILRGIAVLLTISIHRFINGKTLSFGWMGVDLFFVISGFLVSGLLFNEFKNTGTVHGKRFLIRRGFKIYPSFYSFLLISVPVALLFYRQEFYFKIRLLFSEIFFLQNVTGRLWGNTWSLAVEEHFYFLLIGILVLLVRRKWLNHTRKMIMGLLLFIAAIIVIRSTSVFFIHRYEIIAFFSLFRFDSLFFGTLLSYLFYFKKEKLATVLQRLAPFALPCICLLLLPGILFPHRSKIVQTFGYTCIYTAFGWLLVNVVMLPDWSAARLPQPLQKIMQGIAWIGFYSYTIYLWNFPVNFLLANRLETRFMITNPVVLFIFSLSVSIGVGVLFSKLVEIPALRLREKYFPKAKQQHL